jgi:hypothetical protein
VPQVATDGQSRLADGSISRRPDLLRRFTSTPHAADLRLMGRTIRVETNNKALLDLALKFFERHQHGEAAPPDFTWRLVCEPDSRMQTTDVHLSAFSDPGLRFVNLGQRGFLAVDVESRKAVGFFAESYLHDEPRLRHRPPLDILYCLSCASLRVLAMSGGCVGLEDRGVLVFGPPNAGKTTACYLAARLGLKFHADQVVFLDADQRELRAWGDPFPAVFRPEAVKFLPELTESARASTYGDLSFYYFDKSLLQPAQAKPIAPACSIFLDRRGIGEPHLKSIEREDAIARLRDCMLFNEDSQFDAQIGAALRALARQPVYSLRYDRDPKIAAEILEKLIR